MDRKNDEYSRLEKRHNDDIKSVQDRIREKKKFKIKQLKTELDILNGDIER
jgi:hypothetical protein